MSIQLSCRRRVALVPVPWPHCRKSGQKVDASALLLFWLIGWLLFLQARKHESSSPQHKSNGCCCIHVWQCLVCLHLSKYSDVFTHSLMCYVSTRTRASAAHQLYMLSSTYIALSFMHLRLNAWLRWAPSANLMSRPCQDDSMRAAKKHT